MLFADKLIRLRKHFGWTREQLASSLSVSEETILKWETDVQKPDVAKILVIGRIFGVPIEYLIRNDLDIEELLDDGGLLKSLSHDEANDYIKHRERMATRVSLGAFALIFSIIPLVLFGGLTDVGLGETFAAVCGTVLLILGIAVATYLFVVAYKSNAPFAYLSLEPFDLEYGVLDKVKEQREAFRRRYAVLNIIATGMCLLSPMPIVIAALAGNGLLVILMLAVMIAAISIAVATFLYAGIKWSAMQKLVKEGDFSESEKEKKKMTRSVTKIYWGVAAALYLTLSIVTGMWDTTWVIWPVSALLFLGVNTIAKVMYEGKR
jgi:transcriptional regulator with XRE-family HTH domain